MNIIKLYIEVKRKSKSDKSVKDQISEDLKNFSSEPLEYQEKSKTKWNQQKTNLRSLYSENDLVGYQNREGIDYIVFDTNQAQISNVERITLEILIASSIDNIDYSINKVILDIKAILKGSKIKVIKESDVFLYPYDISQGDLYSPTHTIKVEYKKRRLNIWEVIRGCFILFVSLLFSGFHWIVNVNSSYIPIFISIYCAGYFFLLTELIIKIFPLVFNKKIAVSINNLADIIQHNPELPFSSEGEFKIRSPEEGESQ